MTTALVTHAKLRYY